jgi:peptidyl-prolyl cis-trans isomerase SurA
VTESRKSVGKWKVAQILFSLPPDADQQSISIMRLKADSVYDLIIKGGDFAALAMIISEDKLTYLNGGEMAEFSTGKYEPAFEKEFLGLKKDNDVSKPFVTSFGIHIIKRLSVTPTPSDKKDEVYQSELRNKISQDDRIKLSKDKFSETAVKKTGLKMLPAVKESDLFRFADSVKNNTSSTTEDYPISKKSILQFKKETVKGVDWLNYLVNYTADPANNKEESNAVLWKNFQSASAVDYYRKHLEDYSPEFNYQLQEFKEGNMLFEIMEKNVWGKAAADSAGLKEYYEANKEKYLWTPSADIIIVNALSDFGAQEALDSLKSGMDWRVLIESRQGELQADSGRFEIAQINEGKINPVPGTYSEIIKNEDGTLTFYKFIRKYEMGQQRTFEDAKGMVINDYQNVLEKEWIAKLRKKYPVKVNENVLKEILR